MVQTLLDLWTGLGTQARYKAASDLQIHGGLYYRPTQLEAKLEVSDLNLNLKPMHCSKRVLVYHLIIVVDRYYLSQRAD